EGYGQKAESRFTLSGYLRDSASGETLIGATLLVVELNKGVASNEYGFYSLTLPAGNYTIKVSYIGYRSEVRSIALDKDLRLNFALQPNVIETKEVVISAERKVNVESSQMGKQEIKIEQAKTIPALLGEVDVLKTLQLLPGIASAGEGNSGFYVRGGGPDQNLVMLDEAVVYNTGHLFGFFSVFNGDAIKNTTVIKGGMPAKYGGRISSVVDVAMKEGNMKRYEVEGGIGIIASRLTAQGPLWKDKMSFIVSARRTYIDALLRPVLKDLEDGRWAGNGYYFYDINAKFNYRISDKDRVYVSSYFGRDVFNFTAPGGGFGFNFPWGNRTATVRWNHLYSDKLFSNATFCYNDFEFNASTQFQGVKFNVNSSVREYTGKIDFDYSPVIGHFMQFGAQYNYHIFTPYQASGSAGTTTFNNTNKAPKHAHETAIYFLDDFDAFRWLKINAGLRASMFNFVGPFEKITFDRFGRATDTLRFARNENIKTYWGLEPRLSARFKTGQSSSVKLGVTWNQQYIHLVSQSTTTLPVDLWVPSSLRVKPQIGIQYALGYFRNFKDDMYETSVEVYFKDMYNQIEYGESAVGEISVDVEDLFTFGRGYSTGAEFFVKKAIGKFTGWIGYTLAWTWRKFPELNEGKPFYARYDRRHDLSVVVMYEINKRWKVSGTFVFASGQRTTLPVSFYLHEGKPRFIYGPRNWFQLPPYHRLDLGFTYTIPHKGNYYSDITVSIYNAYNRLNPYFIFIDPDGDLNSQRKEDGTVRDANFQFEARQASLFPILPSITWNFKFGFDLKKKANP
ncbi:MAG: TonB-dependent receptor, partial [Chitinophagales bacterium]|nr:TonB-dependent receptor [Chitinophagales bacterium]MDW8274261.1 TonB-dependent receptor [Chitinophagales bacterium]